MRDDRSEYIAYRERQGTLHVVFPLNPPRQPFPHGSHFHFLVSLGWSTRTHSRSPAHTVLGAIRPSPASYLPQRQTESSLALPTATMSLTTGYVVIISREVQEAGLFLSISSRKSQELCLPKSLLMSPRRPNLAPGHIGRSAGIGRVGP